MSCTVKLRDGSTICKTLLKSYWLDINHQIDRCPLSFNVLIRKAKNDHYKIDGEGARYHMQELKLIDDNDKMNADVRRIILNALEGNNKLEWELHNPLYSRVLEKL